MPLEPRSLLVPSCMAAWRCLTMSVQLPNQVKRYLELRHHLNLSPCPAVPACATRRLRRRRSTRALLLQKTFYIQTYSDDLDKIVASARILLYSIQTFWYNLDEDDGVGYREPQAGYSDLRWRKANLINNLYRYDRPNEVVER